MWEDRERSVLLAARSRWGGVTGEGKSGGKEELVRELLGELLMA